MLQTQLVNKQCLLKDNAFQEAVHVVVSVCVEPLSEILTFLFPQSTENSSRSGSQIVGVAMKPTCFQLSITAVINNGLILPHSARQELLLETNIFE